MYYDILEVMRVVKCITSLFITVFDSLLFTTVVISLKKRFRLPLPTEHRIKGQKGKTQGSQNRKPEKRIIVDFKLLSKLFISRRILS
jgi:hypothetical protein